MKERVCYYSARGKGMCRRKLLWFSATIHSIPNIRKKFLDFATITADGQCAFVFVGCEEKKYKHCLHFFILSYLLQSEIEVRDKCHLVF